MFSGAPQERLFSNKLELQDFIDKRMEQILFENVYENKETNERNQRIK